MNEQMRITRLTSLLVEEYGTPSLGNRPDPIEEVVFMLLSEKTDEAKCVKAFECLDRAFASWEAVRDASEGEIAAKIRIAGMAKRRARLIRAALKTITAQFGGLDLSHLRDLDAPRAGQALLAIPGIGHKTARCILLYCFGKHVLPVDNHTYRLAIRLGLIPRTISYEQSHKQLESIVPWNLRRRFHINSVAHGRKRCTSTNPSCSNCPLTRFCSIPGARNERRISVRSKALAMELFSGAGGMSHGFSQAGFDIVQAIEKDTRAAATFEVNHGSTDLVVGDVAEFAPLDVARCVAIRPGDLTAIIGGPPCQGFSESNRRTRTLSNPRNHLYQQFFRYVEMLRPQWFVLENVAGLKTLANGEILETIALHAKSLGYESQWRELNAASYGVPQTRRRIFVIGNRVGAAIAFPPVTHGTADAPLVTVRQAISDLPVLEVGAQGGCHAYKKSKAQLSAYQRLMRNGRDYVNGNLVTNNSDLIVSRYHHIKQGQNWEAIPDELMDNYFDATRCHTGIYYRLKWSEPSKVIGNFRKNMLIHPSQNRGLSVREAARLQSFPDDYEFVGSIGFQQQQVADAVPPLLAEAVAKSVLSGAKRRNSVGTET